MQYSSVMVSMLLWWRCGDGGNGGVTLLPKLLFGVVVALLIFIDMLRIRGIVLLVVQWHFESV